MLCFHKKKKKKKNIPFRSVNIEFPWLKNKRCKSRSISRERNSLATRCNGESFVVGVVIRGEDDCRGKIAINEKSQPSQL